MILPPTCSRRVHLGEAFSFPCPPGAGTSVTLLGSHRTWNDHLPRLTSASEMEESGEGKKEEHSGDLQAFARAQAKKARDALEKVRKRPRRPASRLKSCKRRPRLRPASIALHVCGCMEMHD